MGCFPFSAIQGILCLSQRKLREGTYRLSLIAETGKFYRFKISRDKFSDKVEDKKTFINIILLIVLLIVLLIILLVEFAKSIAIY